MSITLESRTPKNELAQAVRARGDRAVQGDDGADAAGRDQATKHHTKDASIKSKRWGRRWWTLLVWVLLVGVTAVGLAVLAAGRPPARLSQMQAKMAAVAPRSREERARAFEQRFVSVFTEAFPGEATAFKTHSASGGGVTRALQPDGTVRIGLDMVDLNLWLDERFEMWWEAQGQTMPEGLKVWVLTESQDHLGLSVSLPDQLDGRPVTVWITPTVTPETGLLDFKVDSIRLGRVPLPRETVLQKVADYHAVFKDLLQGDGIEPVRAIDDRRARRLTGIEVTPTQLWLLMRAEPRGP